MNVYEESHKLAQAIKESEEYKQLKNFSDEIAKKPELENMINDFIAKQMDIQTKQMMGVEVENNLMEEIQKLSAIVMQDPVAGQYLQAQMRFGIMMQDVYKIIGETASIMQP